MKLNQEEEKNPSHLCNVRSNDGRLGKDIEDQIEPFGEVLATILGEIQARDAAKFDTERLEKDGKEIGHQDDEQMAVLGGSAGLDISSIVSRIDVSDGNEETGADKAGVLLQSRDSFLHSPSREGEGRARALKVRGRGSGSNIGGGCSCRLVCHRFNLDGGGLCRLCAVRVNGQGLHHLDLFLLVVVQT